MLLHACCRSVYPSPGLTKFTSHLCRTSNRFKSTTAAINRGLIRSGRRQEGADRRPVFEKARSGRREEGRDRRVSPILRPKQHDRTDRQRRTQDGRRTLKDKHNRLAIWAPLPPESPEPLEPPEDSVPGWEDIDNKLKVILHKRSNKGDTKTARVPRIIPYTSAQSQFLYGTSTVRAALKTPRRKLHKLYVHSRAKESLTSEFRELIDNAQIRGLEVIYADDSWLPLMDDLANKRPHNGLILEASPLPTSFAASLSLITETSEAEPSTDTFVVTHPTPKKAKPVQSRLRYDAQGWRKPFVLLIDDVLEPGNLGAIIRSAYFLGVDALGIARHTCAPLDSSVALKSSAGAMEDMKLFLVNHPRAFLADSKENGWTVYAGVTPQEAGSSGKQQPGNGGVTFTNAKSAALMEPNYAPLADNPSVLVLGGEGQGLKESLKTHADYFVSMRATPRAQAIDVGVDSLNVSVATALLAAEFMRKPHLEISGESIAGPGSENDLGF